MFELFFQGGWVMYPILLCSLLSWTVILERCFHYGVAGWLRRGDSRRFERLKAVFDASGHLDPAARGRRIKLEAAPFLREDERGLTLLGTVAALGPLLGLFGTVLGLIELFRAIDQSGARPEFSALVGGIWTALLTTAFGMVAALPALVAHHGFDRLASQRADRLEEYHQRLEAT